MRFHLRRWNFSFKRIIHLLRGAGNGSMVNAALVAELVDARDLKSLPTQVGCRFNSCRGHMTTSV